MASISHRGFTHLGMDVSKDSISVAVLDPDRDDAPVDRIFNDDRVGASADRPVR